MMLARLVIPAFVVLFSVSLGIPSIESPRAAETELQELPRHPDWLYARDIEALLSGNTVTAMSKSGSSRWWNLYLEDGVISWINDQGRTDVGTWYIAQDLLCEIWLSDQEKCWGIRFAGKVVRFDDPFTGQPYSAAVLQAGDSKNLRTNVTPEVYESLQELRESRSELAAVGGGTDEVGRSEASAGGSPAGKGWVRFSSWRRRRGSRRPRGRGS